MVMTKQEMIENLIEKYVPLGASTDEIIDMVTVSFEHDETARTASPIIIKKRFIFV